MVLYELMANHYIDSISIFSLKIDIILLNSNWICFETFIYNAMDEPEEYTLVDI